MTQEPEAPKALSMVWPLVSALRWLAASSRRAFLLLFVLGFGLRLFTLTLFPPDQIPPNPLWETGAVTISVAENGTFADPYLIPTGPTAHMPPLWTGAMGLLYRVLGTGYAGGLVRWILVMGIAAALWAALPWVGVSMGLDREGGFLGGLMGAIVIPFASEVESAAALAMATFMVAWVRGWGREGTSPRACVLLGLILGLALHLKPALLPVFLGLLVVGVWRERGGSRWIRIALVGSGIVVACLPWGWRNYAAFHDVFFIRGNFGLELAVGNHPGAHPDIDVSVARGTLRHPRVDLADAERVRDVGERQYMKERQAEALEWIRENPGEFFRLTSLRTLYFWLGPLHDPGRAVPYSLLTLLACLGMWWAWPHLSSIQRGALFIPLLTYPLVYYILAYMPRYGEPVRWILFLLAGSAVWRVLGGGGGGASRANSLR